MRYLVSRHLKCNQVMRAAVIIINGIFMVLQIRFFTLIMGSGYMYTITNKSI